MYCLKTSRSSTRDFKPDNNDCEFFERLQNFWCRSTHSCTNMSIWGYFCLKNWTKMDILHVMQFEEQSSRCQKWRKLFPENDLSGNFAWFFWFFVLDVSDEQSTRRSKRTIVPPLQYWKNERIDYERRKSGRVDGNDFCPSLPSTLFFLSSFLTFSSPFNFNFASGSNDSLVPTMSQVSTFVTITVLPPLYSWLRSYQKTQLHACVV